MSVAITASVAIAASPAVALAAAAVALSVPAVPIAGGGVRQGHEGH